MFSLKFSELSSAAFQLRSQVERLRKAATLSKHPCSAGQSCLAELKRQTARGAREVEAWASQLKDPCALAAAQEAYQVLAGVDSSVDDHRPYWTKTGAVVLVLVEHEGAVDQNRLVKHLIPATLDMVLADPPCSPLRASVGLLSIDDQALLKWARRVPSSRDLVSTMALLLITAIFPTGALAASDRLISHLASATDEARYCGHVPWPSVVTTVVVPLAPCQISLMERRCIAPPVCGRYHQH